MEKEKKSLKGKAKKSNKGLYNQVNAKWGPSIITPVDICRSRETGSSVNFHPPRPLPSQRRLRQQSMKRHGILKVNGKKVRPGPYPL
jgi:hypothetical protein